MAEHLIESLCLNLQYPGAGLEWNRRVSRFAQGPLVSLLEQSLENYEGRIQRLELDLGLIDPNHFEVEITQKLVQGLNKALTLADWQKLGQARKAEEAMRTYFDSGKLPWDQEFGDEKGFLTAFETWWALPQERIWLKETLAQKPSVISRFFYRLGKSAWAILTQLFPQVPWAPLHQARAHRPALEWLPPEEWCQLLGFASANSLATSELVRGKNTSFKEVENDPIGQVTNFNVSDNNTIGPNLKPEKHSSEWAKASKTGGLQPPSAQRVDSNFLGAKDEAKVSEQDFNPSKEAGLLAQFEALTEKPPATSSFQKAPSQGLPLGFDRPVEVYREQLQEVNKSLSGAQIIYQKILDKNLTLGNQEIFIKNENNLLHLSKSDPQEHSLNTPEPFNKSMPLGDKGSPADDFATSQAEAKTDFIPSFGLVSSASKSSEKGLSARTFEESHTRADWLDLKQVLVDTLAKTEESGFEAIPPVSGFETEKSILDLPKNDPRSPSASPDKPKPAAWQLPGEKVSKDPKADLTGLLKRFNDSTPPAETWAGEGKSPSQTNQNPEKSAFSKMLSGEKAGGNPERLPRQGTQGPAYEEPLQMSSVAQEGVVFTPSPTPQSPNSPIAPDAEVLGKEYLKDHLDPKALQTLGKPLDRQFSKGSQKSLAQRWAQFRQDYSRSKPQPTHTQWFIEPKEKEGVWFIKDAGLVLASPFFGAWLKDLNLTQNGAFVDKGAQLRALALIVWLADPKMTRPEWQWALPKLLVGLLPSQPVPPFLPITVFEKAKGLLLLKSIISRWPLLKNTSPDTLRNSFLARPGRLVEEANNWLLQVETSPFDVLLPGLTWGFGMQKFSWMKKPLITHWP
ncbi:MAG: hypothetical protein A2527_00885 [Candidatus Lambdaproteobacteria bacterium RIFOXYD2_FULL_50_16]|uniref:Uncharacterized protein n=1 Tax=Candidatus Lambdaproteobacteria bacterium RIFOXYD2_FULL_50_16 TaxID=1817772 RepID=A0A1F6G8W6_9PROT|nr:MAG: hypothetical protein A2527_00885 [Candidatus Lambdaproteobacteria bacterium RIFOXYD2_FULL_50_16]